MRGLGNARSIDGLNCHLYSRNVVVALNDVMILRLREFQHLVDKAGNAVGVFDNLLVNVLQRRFVIRRAGHGQQLGKAREDVERSTYLMRNLLDKVTLHARRLLCTNIGPLQVVISSLQTHGRTMAEEDENA